MTKKQVLELLHISNSTLDRRMKDGTYKFTKAAGRFGEVTFTRSDLGLPELPEIKLPYQDPIPPEPKFIRCEPKYFIRPTPAIEKKQQEDLAFATAYKMGQATDSFGNKIDGSNDRCPESGVQTLVPVPVREYCPPADSQAHMSEVHRINTDIPSANHSPLNPGVDEQTLNAMRVQWSGRGGGRSESELEKKQRNDRFFLTMPFPRG